MCYILTIAIPESRTDLWKSAIPRGFSSDEIRENHIIEALPKGFSTFTLTTGGCSCSLYDDPDEAPDEVEDVESRLRKKYKKRNWSDAKIERAVSQAINAKPAPKDREPGLRKDACELVSAVAAGCGRVYLYVHHYSGSVAEEPPVVAKTIRVTTQHLIKRPDCVRLDLLVAVDG